MVDYKTALKKLLLEQESDVIEVGESHTILSLKIRSPREEISSPKGLFFRVVNEKPAVFEIFSGYPDLAGTKELGHVVHKDYDSMSDDYSYDKHASDSEWSLFSPPEEYTRENRGRHDRHVFDANLIKEKMANDLT